LICVCSYYQSQCSDVTVTNNIAAGGIYAGLVIPGHECGDYDNKNTENYLIKGNVAHSMGGDGGIGIVVYGNKPNCIESSYNAAYKNMAQGIYYY
jgi:hypothetical protein